MWRLGLVFVCCLFCVRVVHSDCVCVLSVVRLFGAGLVLALVRVRCVFDACWVLACRLLNVCVVFVWCMFCVSVLLVWCVFYALSGACLVLVFNLCLVFVWSLFDLCFVPVWCLFCMFFVSVWCLLGVFLVLVCCVVGACLVRVLYLFCISLAFVWRLLVALALLACVVCVGGPLTWLRTCTRFKSNRDFTHRAVMVVVCVGARCSHCSFVFVCLLRVCVVRAFRFGVCFGVWCVCLVFVWCLCGACLELVLCSCGVCF